MVMRYQSTRILIIRLGSIGDVVRTLPALRTIRQESPSAYIAWLVEEKARDILEGHPDLDRVIVFPREKIVRGFSNPFTCLQTLALPLRFVSEIKKMKFDLVLDFHGILKSGLIAFFSGASNRVGFSRGYCQEMNYIFNNRHINPGDRRLNRIEKNLKLLSVLGIGVEELDPSIPITRDDCEKIDDFFLRNMAHDHHPLIAIHPGTSPSTPYKRWNEERYARLADSLIEDYQAKAVLTWGPDELATVNTIAGLMKHPPIIAFEMDNLRQLAEIFRRCDLYVGSDTGPMHIAASVRTPVVAIFGPTDHVVNAPSRKNQNIIVRSDVACSPCREYCCPDRTCMKAVSLDAVREAVVTLLDLHTMN